MFPDSVLNVLMADNPWMEGADTDEWVMKYLPSPYIERRAKIKIGRRVTLVIGPRQVGKSTLIWKTLAGEEGPYLYVNCEERAIVDWAVSPALFVRALENLIAPGTIVFFEEVQRLDEAGLFLKGLVDRKSSYRFVATGSSSYELDAKTKESLAGRADRHLLLPLSLSEIAPGKDRPVALQLRARLEAAHDLVLQGGYPTVHLGQNKQALLTGLVESFVIRDASDRFRIRHTAAFRKLLELMASQIGNLCNFSKWAEVAGVSADTVSDYAAILTDAHVVKLVRPFVGGKRAEITSTPKVYFVDNGIRNRLFGGFGSLENRADRGALVENFVFTELYKSLNPLLDSIRFWRSKSGAEVDFVVERDGALYAVEVKAGRTRGKLSRAARSFMEAYRPQQFWMIGDERHDGFKLGDTDVRFATIADVHRIFER